MNVNRVIYYTTTALYALALAIIIREAGWDIPFFVSALFMYVFSGYLFSQRRAQFSLTFYNGLALVFIVATAWLTFLYRTSLTLPLLSGALVLFALLILSHRLLSRTFSH